MVKIVLKLLWDLAVMLNDNALGTSLRAQQKQKPLKCLSQFLNNLSIIICVYFSFIHRL